jgi:two-component system response regulator HydG
MTMAARILVVDDDQSMCEAIEKSMRLRGFDIAWDTRADDALARLAAERFDVLLADLNMPGMNGISLCERTKDNWPDVPVVIITAFGSLDSAIAAIRAGAFDFVTKPIQMDMLAISLRRAADLHALREEVKVLHATVQEFRHYGELLGSSTRMQSLYEQMRRIACSDSSVLIAGESGTGKELAARTLHLQSHRNASPFVAVNCANLPENLLESELFGHTRGSFTDAREERKGLFLQAQGGTLVLDEIAEFPLALQPKVLRALEARRVRPVGSDAEIPFDARIIAITNRNLQSAVEEGRFRQDLYYRINVIQLELPPLRSRRSDILLLAQHFLEHFRVLSGKNVTGISENVAERLLAYEWPGNVRELRNTIERAVAVTREQRIAAEDLPEGIRAYRPSRMVIEGNDPAELVPMEEVERRYILHVLKITGGNRTHAARILGLERRTLQRKLAAYEVLEAQPE